MLAFIAELRRRNVLRVAVAYLVVAWLIVQVAATLLPLFGFGEGALRAVVILLAVGLVPALVFSWAFEITPEGLRRERDIDRSRSIAAHTGRKLDRVIMVVLALALGYFVFDRFVLSPSREAEKIQSARQEGRSEALTESYGDKSIAVLPFVDMSPGHDQEYFSDGIAEELLNLLAKIPDLRVISRSSAFSFKGKNLDVPEIATQLNVAHILEGSVRRDGNRVRITAQLIDARSDTHLWSETYDRTVDDIFAVQNEIAAAVVEQLRIELLGAAPRVRATNPEAYTLYMQARFLFQQRSAATLPQSIQLYQQALALDPAYASAWAGLAHDYLWGAVHGQRSRTESYALAQDAAEMALAIDPDCAQAHQALAAVSLSENHDFPAAARQYARALALDPTDSEILRGAAFLLRNLGRYEAAIAVGRHAVARDPVSPSAHRTLGVIYQGARRFDESIASLRLASRLSPDMAEAHSEIGFSLVLKGESRNALDEMRLELEEPARLCGIAIAEHAAGRPRESEAALRQLTGKYGDQEPYLVAWALAFRDEADGAFEWLEKANREQEPSLYGLAGNRLLDNLHDDPRWLPFLRKIGVAPEQVARIEFEVRLPGLERSPAP